MRELYSKQLSQDNQLKLLKYSFIKVGSLIPNLSILSFKSRFRRRPIPKEKQLQYIKSLIDSISS